MSKLELTSAAIYHVKFNHHHTTFWDQNGRSSRSKRPTDADHPKEENQTYRCEANRQEDYTFRVYQTYRCELDHR